MRVPDLRTVPNDPSAIERVFDELGWERAAIKPTVGASGHAVELVTRGAIRAAVADEQA